MFFLFGSHSTLTADIVRNDYNQIANDPKSSGKVRMNLIITSTRSILNLKRDGCTFLFENKEMSTAETSGQTGFHSAQHLFAHILDRLASAGLREVKVPERETDRFTSMIRRGFFGVFVVAVKEIRRKVGWRKSIQFEINLELKISFSCTQSFLKVVPTVDLGFTEKVCAVCLCEFDDGDELIILNCKHSFHNACVSTWFWSFSKGKKSPTCPTCRASVDMSDVFNLRGYLDQPGKKKGKKKSTDLEVPKKFSCDDECYGVDQCEKAMALFTL